VHVDECKTWADRAAALASYARQADDDSLQKFALRIQSRAIRRAGELLQEFQTGPQGGRPKNSGGAPTVSQRQAAAGAGMSKDQEVQAVRVANVPAEDFEALVESEHPPTVTRLAERGTEKRPAVAAPPGAREATHVIGVLHELARDLPRAAPAVVAGAVLPHEVREICANVAIVEDWLAVFLANLPEASC
jgi:hypothetical protein